MTDSTFTTAVKRFRDEVYAKAEAIDPHQNHDMHDIALGFLLACGVPRETLTWTVLSNLSCGEFDIFLDPARVWAQDYLTAKPQYVTVRLGHGWDPNKVTPVKHLAWVDAIDPDGRHLAASQDAPLPSIPEHVTQWVIDNVPLGERVEYGRPSDI